MDLKTEQEMIKYDDQEYHINLVNNDSKLKHLPADLKHHIGYLEWFIWCGSSDTSRPISSIVKKVIKLKNTNINKTKKG